MPRTLALVICILLAGAMGWAASRPPAPRPAGGDGFSAVEAMADVRDIAARPHPIGSADHDRVRDRLLARLRAIGLSPEVHRGQALEAQAYQGDRYVQGGAVQNVVAVLAGRSRTAPAVLVMAHYDSVPGSPGAADDAAGVAAALQIAQRLGAGPQPRRDVIFLITDGEEAGLLGARAFFAHDPLAKRTGVVLNMEARGGGGRVFMFETGARNGDLIRLFARHAANPTATSLAGYIYDRMPNDTDLTVAKARGLAGMNFAFIGRPFDYHAASSTPAVLDQGSLQHMGDQVLAAARALAAAPDLPARTPDVVYADLLGGPVIVYPPWAGWMLLALAAGLGGLAFARAFRAEPFHGLEAARGAAALLGTLLLSGLLLTLVRWATGVPGDFLGQRPLLARFGLYEAALAAACLAGTLLAFAAAAARGRDRFWSAFAGALVLCGAPGVALQLAAPLTAFMVQWPLLAATLLALVLAWRWNDGHRRPTARAVAVAVASLTLAQLLYVAHPVALGVGAEIPQALAALTLLAALVMFPLLWPERGDRAWAVLAATAAVAGLLLALAIRLVDPWSPRHPRPTDLSVVADLDTGAVVRASALPRLDAWTRTALQADGLRPDRRPLQPFARSAWTAPARAPALPRPLASVQRDASGRVTVRVVPAVPARELRLDLRSPGPLARATINGRPAVLAGPGRWTHISWSDPAGLEVAFDAGQARLQGRFAQVSDGWPASVGPLTPRPANAMPWGNSDTTVSIGTLPPG